MARFHSSVPGHKRLAAWEGMGSENRRSVVRWGVRWGGKQDVAEDSAFCELSSHYYGFGEALMMTAVGIFFHNFSCSLPGKSRFSKYISAWLTQTIQQFAVLALQDFTLSTVSPQWGNHRLGHGYRAWLWLARRLSTVSIRKHTAAGLITVS